MTVPIDIAITRDGSYGVAVVDVDPTVGRLRITERGLGGSVRIDPEKDDEIRLRVLIDSLWLRTDREVNRSPPHLRIDEGLEPFFAFVLGESLDAAGPAIFGPEPIVAATDAVLQAHHRAAARSREIEAYVAGKIHWGYEFGLSPLGFGLADERRLGVPLARINEVAVAAAGSEWSVVDGPRQLFRLLDARSRRLRSSGAILLHPNRVPWRPGDDVPRRGMEKALDLYAAGDLENAVKEAVGALETVALAAAEMKKGTLGDAIKKLRRTGVLQAPIDKLFEAVWGYSSQQRGVRHGSGDGAIDPHTATYVIDSAASAITYLLSRPNGE